MVSDRTSTSLTFLSLGLLGALLASRNFVDNKIRKAEELNHELNCSILNYNRCDALKILEDLNLRDIPICESESIRFNVSEESYRIEVYIEHGGRGRRVGTIELIQAENYLRCKDN
jgi:uncharacterized Fe-S cluster-containing protein